ncbi:ABC transporter ATP-binding protein [Lysinibacillus sp. fkY74-1]|uniref:Multidrug ABC transporter permease n=3 Tax=Lysinibacillus TaxID=400634 RepID=W7S8D4_LYSSH|nr:MULTISPECIES: ABC transporter ATP-binding protein [Lysinibacillus]MBE5083981.1 ABC transporter ATP-binding protein [Bacillus thuringiensis]ACA40796.1 Putative ABC transporter ATP-binding protein exp8 (Exported protein 8) [Lysinibacillus sphaericus C3-41]AMO33239.1 ABC transporter ATP-binding protein [Lysinibacillus sphaericus]AMR91658.1 ABC transporter ATP-binding protein [Lysinibacillus sphaericus]ANA45705.1 ABC transporter ATP-binding protein [Lysinibacillus sphaericus]
MSTSQRLMRYAMYFKKPIFLGLFFLTIAVFTELVGPFIAKHIIDNYMTIGHIEIKPITWLLIVYLLLAIATAILRYFMYIYLQIGANRVVQKLRKDVFEHIQTLPIQYFDNLPAGKIVARVTNDTEAVRNLYVQVLSNFVTSFISIFGVYIALFILNWKMAMLALTMIPIVYLWMILYRKVASKYNDVIRTKIADINAMINESIQGMTIIQAFRREQQMTKEFDDMNNEHYAYERKLLVLDSATSFNLVNTLRLIMFTVFIVYFGTQSYTATEIISAGTLYAFVDYLTKLFNPITNIVNQFSQLERSLIAGKRVFEVLDTDGEPVSEKSLPRYKGNVLFEDVSFAYKDNEYVLKNLSFEAHQGETIALVGHTGSGKSSIMNLLFRFYDPSKGKISIDGIDITSVPRQTMREHMGIVLQDPYLFTGTIASNVSLNNPNISPEKIKDSLNAVGGERVLANLPNGYDEPVIEKGSTLSSGQRQLISFARALAFDPAILILDEATSNIDTETEEIIQHAMDVLKKGRTTFIIAHRLSTIKNADRILVLDRGRIVENGTHDELLELGGIYEKMYQMQANSLQ